MKSIETQWEKGNAGWRVGTDLQRRALVKVSKHHRSGLDGILKQAATPLVEELAHLDSPPKVRLRMA
jgi:hypothetical protein